MKIVCIKNFGEILKLSEEYNVRFENAMLFRGTSSPLLPSLVEKCSFRNCEDLAYKEFELFSEFNSFSSLNYSYKNEISKDWEKRIAAREHGLSSSLMDWSNNIKMATEFAIHNFQKKKINFTSVWFLIKNGINQIDINDSMELGFGDIDKPMILNYILGANFSSNAYSRRKFIQGGFFLKQSYTNICEPLNQNSFFEDKLIQIIIPKDVVPNIWNSLSGNTNLNMTAMPPETTNISTEALDNICKNINLKYR